MLNMSVRALVAFLVLFNFLVLQSQRVALAAPPASSETELSVSQDSFKNETQNKIETLFNNLETIGNSYNAEGEKSAGLVALDASCQIAVDRFLKTNLVHDMTSGYKTGFSTPLPQADQWVTEKIAGLSLRAKQAFCSMLKGENIQSPDWEQTTRETVRRELIPALMMNGVNWAKSTNLPFLTRLEIELGTTDNDLISSITTIQPLWQDPTDTHHILTQLSYHKAPEETDNNGFRVEHDTINAGLAYRHLSVDKQSLYGANIFFDHAPKRNHNRISLGIDARTSQLAVSANRYMPLSGWKSHDLYFEDRAAAGWDLELRGQIPEFPSWTASIKGYQWDNQDNGHDLYGVTTAIEYSPVPALAIRLGLDDNSQNSPDFQAIIRFNYRFDQPQDLQWKQRTELAPVSDYVYEKVHRENIIRTKVRRKHTAELNVIETSGSNTAIENTGSSALYVGQTLLMPTTVTTANTAGAYARLRFAKGATLTLGQNTQIRIVPDLITLVTGNIQYISDGVITNIAVPGGTIALHGTDLDIVSNGTDTSVRVRDGRVTFTGSVAGSATLGPEEMAESIAGVVGTVAIGSANYITHTDLISTQIDRVANPLTGIKVAPYPVEAPYIVSEDLTPGQSIIIGLKYNAPVSVSGAIPFMDITINGNPGIATYISGSGSKELRFAYTVQVADSGAGNITINGLDQNGATFSGDGKDAVTTIADVTLTLSGSVTDTTPPSGYTVAFTTDPVNNANQTAAAFSISSAEIGSTYNYTISSSGAGTNVTGSGTITTATQNITGVDVSGLGDGTLTISLTLTDTASNVGAAVTDTVTKDIVAPYIVSVAPPASATYAP